MVVIVRLSPFLKQLQNVQILLNKGKFYLKAESIDNKTLFKLYLRATSLSVYCQVSPSLNKVVNQ